MRNVEMLMLISNTLSIYSLSLIVFLFIEIRDLF